MVQFTNEEGNEILTSLINWKSDSDNYHNLIVQHGILQMNNRDLRMQFDITRSELKECNQDLIDTIKTANKQMTKNFLQEVKEPIIVAIALSIGFFVGKGIY